MATVSAHGADGIPHAFMKHHVSQQSWFFLGGGLDFAVFKRCTLHLEIRLTRCGPH